MHAFAVGLFDSSGFVPRAQCGAWTPGLIWLHVVSDLLIWVAYVSIPVVLLTFARLRDVPFHRVFVLFALFILSCGFVHLVEAVIFFEPIYRFSGLLKAFTAVVSLLTVAALVPIARRVFQADRGNLLAILQPGRAGGFGVRGVSAWVTVVWVTAVVVLVVNTSVSSYNINTLIYNEDLVTHTRVVKQELTGVLSSMKDAETGHRGFLIAGKDPYLAPFVSGTRAAREALARLEVMTADNPDQSRDAARLRELITAKNEEMTRTLAVNGLLGRDAAYRKIATDQGMHLMEGIRETVARMEAREDALLAERATVARNKYRATTVTSLFGGGLSLVMIVLGYGLIRWEFGRRLAAESVIKQREADLARSEDQFRTMAAAVPQIVWVARPDGHRDYYNAKWYQFTGLTPAQSLGWEWNHALHPDDRERGMARWKLSLQTGVEYEIEYRFRGADGRYRWFLGRALPQRDAAGAIVRWFGSCTDITDRRKAEELVRRSERNLTDFFENANVGLHWVGPDGVILRANRAELEMLGYTRDEYIGRPIAAFHESQEAIGDILARLKRGERLDNYAARLRRKDGTIRDVLISSTVFWEDGKFVHSRCFTRDVTELKRAEEELAERARATALRANVATALASGGEMRAALQACAETLVDHVGAALARVWTVDPSGEWLELQASAGLYTHTNGNHGRIRVGEFKIGQIAASRTPHTTNDVPGDPNVSDPEWAKREGIVSFAGYPLVVDDRVLGVVGLFARQPLSGAVVADLSPLVSSIAQYVRRQRVEAAIRTSEYRYRTLTEAIPQVVWNATDAGEVTYFNRRWLEYTRLPLENSRGRGWLAAAHPGDAERVLTAWQGTVAAARAGAADQFQEEVRLRRGDTGEFRWFLSVAVPLRRPDGTIDQWIGSMADVHDQKTAAEVVRESEAKFRQLAESIPQLVWMTDSDGYIFWYNQRWYDYTGTTLDEMRGWGWQAVHDPAELPRVVAKFKAHIASGEPWEDTFPLRRHDGAMRWHLSRARPIRDEGGRIVRWFGTNTDVTEQRELEQRLRAGEARFRTLTEAVPQMVWTADPAGEVTFFNRRWDEYTGLPFRPPPDARTPDKWGDVVHPEDAAQLQAQWQLAVARQPERFTNEFRLRRGADRAYRWMLSTAVPLRDAGGAVTEWVGSITDIDDQKQQAANLERLVRERTAALLDEVEERRRAERQVQAVAAELARSNGELEQFAYIASHDLQEPLRKIQAFGDRLKTKYRDQVAEGGREYIDRMLTSAGRMRQLIDDLLTFSRVSTQSRTFARVDLGKVAGEVVSDLSIRLEQTGGEVRVGELPEVDADPMQMRQLFQNLIANAIKFQRPGVPPVVEIAAAVAAGPPDRPGGAAGPYCRLTVRDNGIGFDTKYLDRIFQVFQRLHGREEYEGTGVGLAICRRIAERHGGAITAESQPGGGATFVVTLPVNQTHVAGPPADPGG